MMKMKKIMGVLALTSILGSSVTGPLNVLLAEAFASQKGVNSGYVVPNPNLYTATGKRIDAGNGYFTLEGKKMQHGDHVTNDEGEKGLVGGSSLFLEDRPNLFFYSDSSDMTVSHYRVGVEDEQENVLSTELKTVPGKEYVLTFDLYTRIGSVAASDFGDSLTKMGITDKNKCCDR
ncbi:hypothetical protein PGRAN_13428 [Listeria grandensis FSL F6-0971]|uniref:Uncharacterized protein n=1 Tax=Listeria grandensis FSL F6-0971 TaxID=1265819 RepID=W7BPN8_9LIST|nr:hypothetical protein [Listeria grandensis]EUJ22068.1 hypothetical protein PGRAN_13428 [Listeria grandensis FSL F6-0971]